MKIKLTTARCGHTFNAKGQLSGEYGHSAGAVIDMNDDDAKRLIEAGQAVRADTSNK
jgi:hypothetical protein